MLSEAEKITHRQDGISCHFAFEDDVPLVDERILKTVSEVIDRGRARRCGSQNVREERSHWIPEQNAWDGRTGCAGSITRTRLRNGANCLSGRQTRVDERVDADRAVDAAVVHSVAAAQASLAITTEIRRETNTRTKVVLVAGTITGLRQRRIYEERFWKRFVVPTQSEVQCQPR